MREWLIRTPEYVYKLLPNAPLPSLKPWMKNAEREDIMNHIAKKNADLHKAANKKMVQVWRKVWQGRRNRALNALGQQVYNKRIVK